MKIAVLGNADGWYVRQICEAFAARGHVATPFGFPDLHAVTNDDGNQIYLAETASAEFDAIIVRTMPPGSLEQVVLRMNLLAAVERSGTLVLNPAKAIECAVDKGLTTLKLRDAGLPVPSTAVCETTEQAIHHFQSLGQDMVVKPIFGSEGRGILRVTDEQMAWRTFRTLERLQSAIYLQRFVSGPGEDIRILVLNGEVIGAMKRFAAAGDFRSNAAQQGSATTWTPTADEAEAAIKATEATGCIFAGIDLMYDEEGHLQVIEVNAVPGWKTLEEHCEVDVPGTLVQWLEKRLSIT